MMQVGDWVEVEVDNRLQGMLVWTPPIITYRGQVCTPYPWAKPGDLCLSTDRRDGFIRLIAARLIRNIRAIDGEALPIPIAKGQEDGQWRIQGSRGHGYTVNRRGGHWSCSCPAGSYNKECRHVISAQKSLDSGQTPC